MTENDIPKNTKNLPFLLSLVAATKEQRDDLAKTGKRKIVIVDGTEYHLYEGDKTKACIGKDYSYLFDKVTGDFKRWGKTFKDDPQSSPVGPEIADIEITTSCNGINGVPCPFCYKSNTANGTYMTLETFQKVFANFGPSLTQIAFGADSQCKSNPDCWKIFDYTRQHGVIPNITVAQVDDDVAFKLSRVMGAVAVSRYEDKNICYDIVKKLGALSKEEGSTLKQVNIHILVAEETYDKVMETIEDSVNDPELKKYLNAIVLLSLKRKGRGEKFTPLSEEKFKTLVDKAFSVGARIGFDSCTCNKFLRAVKTHKDLAMFETLAEPCESFCFSIYVDVMGKIYPCSFLEEKNEWANGIDITQPVAFLKDVWYSETGKAFRNKLEASKRSCPVYEV